MIDSIHQTRRPKTEILESIAMNHLEKTFTGLLEFISDISVFAKDNDGHFIYVNSSFAEKCGFRSPLDIIGLTDLDVWPKSLGEKYRMDDVEILRTGNPRVDVVELITAVGQDAQWYSTTKIPITDPSGKVLGVAGYSREMNTPKLKPTPINALTASRDYIVAHYSKPIDINDLADHACLSLSQFDRRFKATFKISPRKYITMIRIQAACHALSKTDAQISTIARDCGFYDLSHLNHQFRKEMGISPRDYRKAYT